MWDAFQSINAVLFPTGERNEVCTLCSLGVFAVHCLLGSIRSTHHVLNEEAEDIYAGTGRPGFRVPIVDPLALALPNFYPYSSLVNLG